MKKLLAAVFAAALVVCASSSAKATAFNIGTPLSGSYTTVGVLAEAGSNTYDFTVNASSSLAAFTLTLFTPISGLALTLLNGIAVITPDSLSATSTFIQNAYSGLNTSGSYHLVVSGDNAGTYFFGASVSPVPVPAALPLLGAGLVALGAFARRRRPQAA